MILKHTHLDQFATGFDFHRPEHKSLSLELLSTLAKQIQFKLKLQKASIQLIDKAPFGVIGLRRSKANIFVEFYTEDESHSPRIIRRQSMPNQLTLNRVELSAPSDIDEELIHWIIASQRMA